MMLAVISNKMFDKLDSDSVIYKRRIITIRYDVSCIDTIFDLLTSRCKKGNMLFLNSPDCLTVTNWTDGKRKWNIGRAGHQDIVTYWTRN